MMPTPWLPTWLAVVWTAAYVVIVVLHVRHAATMSGAGRWWHSGHIVMALGMADMFWPHPPHSFFIPSTGWTIIFAVGAVAALVMAVRRSFVDRRPSLLWLVVAVDFGAMTWMWVMMRFSAPLLTIAFIVWCVIEAVGWMTGALVSEADTALHASSAVAKSAVPAGHGDGHSAGPSTELPVGPGDDASPQSAHGDHVSHGGLSMRISLAVMALGMAFMFAVMQFGMPAHMSGMGTSSDSLGQMHMSTPGPTPSGEMPMGDTTP